MQIAALDEWSVRTAIPRLQPELTSLYRAEVAHLKPGGAVIVVGYPQPVRAVQRVGPCRRGHPGPGVAALDSGQISPSLSTSSMRPFGPTVGRQGHVGLADFGQGVLVTSSCVTVDHPQPGFGEAFGGHVAAGDGPLVVLFGEDGADESDHGVAVGEDPDDVGAAAEFLVEPLLGVVGPDLAPVLLREPGEREHVGRGLGEWVAASGNRSVSCSTTRACWAQTDVASGCSKIVRTSVATIDCADFGTRVSRLRM